MMNIANTFISPFISADLSRSVEVNGDSISLSQLVAIVESLEQERPNLFGFLKSFQSSPEEMALFYRQMIREDYDSHAQQVAVAAALMPSAPLASPDVVREDEEGLKKEEEEVEEKETKESFGGEVLTYLPPPQLSPGGTGAG